MALLKVLTCQLLQSHNIDIRQSLKGTQNQNAFRAIQGDEEFDEKDAENFKDTQLDLFHLVICSDLEMELRASGAVDTVVQTELGEEEQDISEQSQTLQQVKAGKEATKKIQQINDVNKLLKRHAKYFHTSFIKYNDGQDDDFTQQILKIVQKLDSNGDILPCKNATKLKQRIDKKLNMFDNLRSAKDSSYVNMS